MLLRLVLAVSLALACLTITHGSAFAAANRPNSLDVRVSALREAQLMSLPASQLVDQARQTAAQRLVRWMLPGWIASVIFPVIVLGYFWQSGSAARTRDWLRMRTRHEAFTRFLFGAELAALVQAAAAIPEFYLYRVQRIMGLSVELYRFWSIGWLLTTLAVMLLGGITAAAVLWLVDRTHQWYLYTIAAIVAVSFGIALAKPMAIAPFERYAVMPRTVAVRADALERRAGLRVPIDYVVRGDSSSLGTAGVLGIGPTMRVIVSDTLVGGGSLAEVDWALAEQLGHVARRDPFRNAAWAAGFIILGAALAVFVADRIGFRRDDDALSRLALVAALMGCAYFAVAPVDNAMLQAETARADSFALALARNRPAAVRAVVRAVDERMDEICPSLGARLFLDRMPPPAERISSFNGTRTPCP